MTNSGIVWYSIVCTRSQRNTRQRGPDAQMSESPKKKKISPLSQIFTKKVKRTKKMILLLASDSDDLSTFIVICQYWFEGPKRKQSLFFHFPNFFQLLRIIKKCVQTKVLLFTLVCLGGCWWCIQSKTLIKERKGAFLGSRGRQEMDLWLLCSHPQGHGYPILYYMWGYCICI